MSQRTILIVDDNPEDCATFRRYLTHGKGNAYRVLTVISCKAALERLRHETPDCILLDFDLPDMDGLALLALLKHENDLQRFPVVMLTGLDSIAVAVEAMKQGAQDYMTKGTTTAESLVHAIENAINKHSLHRMLEALREELKRKNAELETQRAAMETENVRLLAKKALQESAERLEFAQQVAHVGSWEFDLTTQEITWSKEFFALVGVAPDRGTLDYATNLALFTPEDAARLNACVQRTIHEGIGYALDVQQSVPEGEIPRWYHMVGKPIFDAQETVVRLVGTLLDITERKSHAREMQTANERLTDANAQLVIHGLRAYEQGAELEAQNTELNSANVLLEALATTDGLTGLKNRRRFQERLADEYQRALRYNIPLSVVMLDVDHFKSFNDTFGHPAGDVVLRNVADILQATGRTTDLVARYGGEEFVLLLPETDEEGARRTAERIRHAIAEAIWEQRAITVSVGAATLSLKTPTAQSLVGLADNALYFSKCQGRNRVTHASELSAAGHGQSVHSTPLCDEVFQPLRIVSENPLASYNPVSPETLLADEALLLSHESTVASWSRLLDLKDKETQGHSERVTALTTQLAEFMGMSPQEGHFARWGALLHDIGKIGIPDAILFKPGPLTEAEWSVMRQHPTLAYEMLMPSAFLHPALDIPYCHHEKWDGTGYPRGLREEEIPLAARLFAVVDVYDALGSDRPYRIGWPKEKVREYLQAEAGTHFDPYSVEALLKMLDETETLRDGAILVHAA